MQPKRIITLLLVVVLTFICGVTSISAQDNAAKTLEIAVEATSSTAIVSEPVSVNAGATVDVSVAIKANPGVTAIDLTLNYDVKALTPKLTADNSTVDVKLNKFFAGSEQIFFDAEKGTVRYLGMVADIMSSNVKDVTATGALFTLTFTVNKDYHGEAALTLSDYANGVINSKFQVVSSTVSDGTTKDYNKATVSTHKWGTPTVVKADCLVDGTTTHTCTDTACKKSVVVLDQKALGHDLTDPATCTTAQTCKREGCDYVAEEAKGHTPAADAAKAPTCTETGLTAGSHCSVCNTVLVAQEEVAKEDHTYGDWAVEKEATKKEQGLKAKTCTVCGDKITEAMPVLPSSNTGMIVIIIVLAVVVLAAGGFCLYWFVLRKKKTA
jgi:hypothetical protein